MRKKIAGLALILVAGCQPAAVPVPTEPSPGIRPASGEALGAPVPAPSSGPGISTPGILLTATPRLDGDLDVTEQVVLRGPASMVRLRPPTTGQTVPALAKARPAAVDFMVVADGEHIDLAPEQVRDAQDLPLVPAATRLDLSYRLVGASVQSMPSKSRRALAVLAPLTAPTDGTLPTGLIVNGLGLRNAVCPRLTETRCAVGEFPGMSIQPAIPAEQAVAVIQLDLPGPVPR